MLLEINVGLLGAVAIVASLLGLVFEGKFYNRWILCAIGGFGLSGLFSAVVLIDMLRTSLLMSPVDLGYQVFLTYIAMGFFLFSTEVLILLSIRKFWRLGRAESGR